MLRLIRLIAKESPGVFTAALLLSIVSALSTMSILTVIFVALGGTASNVTWPLFALYALLTVVTRSTARGLLAYITRGTVRKMRIRLTQLITSASLQNLEQIGRSRLITSFAEDVGNIAGVLPDLVTVFANTVFIVSCLTYLGHISAQRLLIVLASIGVGVVVYRFTRRRYVRQQQISRERWDILNRTFYSIVNGLKEMKFSRDRRDQMLDEFQSQAADLQQAAALQSFYMLALLVMMGVLLYLTLGLSIFDFRGGLVDTKLMAAYGISILYLAGPLRDLVGLLPNFAGANISLAKLDQMNLRFETVAPEELPPVKPMEELRSIEAIDLQYHYEDEDSSQAFSVGPVNVTLFPGEVLFIVGGNGTGKTTVAKVLTKLYGETGGELRVNGEPLQAHQVPAYRESIAAIFNDFELFEKLSCSDAPDFEPRVAALLTRLRMGGRVNIDAGRLATTSDLSTGERKRLVLMDALLSDKKLYLFDEWAADQDPVFREIFYREILDELRRAGKMVIVISHDERYFSLADKLMMLERGEPPRVVCGHAKQHEPVHAAQAPTTHEVPSQAYAVPRVPAALDATTNATLSPKGSYV